MKAKLSKEQKKFLDVSTNKGVWIYNPETGKVDVHGSVNVPHLYLNGVGELPVAFGIVYGNFLCNENNITTFKNFPDVVKGKLCIICNRISEFEYQPEEIGELKFNLGSVPRDKMLKAVAWMVCNIERKGFPIYERHWTYDPYKSKLDMAIDYEMTELLNQ